MNLTVRRNDTQKIIDDDPWSVTVYREGLTPDNTETTFACTGKIVPAAARGASREQVSAGLTGESSIGIYGWALLAPYDTTPFLTRDELVAVQQSTGVSRKFRVVYSQRYAYKYEVILDERQ